MITCKCGCESFNAHQRLYVDIVVDRNANFLKNQNNSIESSIYEAEDPYGPFTCTRCGAEYDTDASGDIVQTEKGYLDDLSDNMKFTVIDNDTLDKITVTIVKNGKDYSYTVTKELDETTMSGNISNSPQPMYNIFTDIMYSISDDYDITNAEKL